MKFISRPRVITAQQFILGQTLPQGVKFHENCSNPDAFSVRPGVPYALQNQRLPEGSQPAAGCSLDGHYYVRRSEHENVIVKDGDWIVPVDRVIPGFENLYFNVIKPEVMAEQFQEVANDPDAATNLTPAAQSLRAFMIELRNYFQANRFDTKEDAQAALDFFEPILHSRIRGTRYEILETVLYFGGWIIADPKVPESAGLTILNARHMYK